MTNDASPASDNEIFLRGRLAADADVRLLPSGDELCVFRLTVDRPPTARAARAKVDSIDCASGSARVRRTVMAAPAGQLLEVRGSLHRRFWRGAAGLGSRYEVDVRTVARLSRPRTGASAARKPASA